MDRHVKVKSCQFVSVEVCCEHSKSSTMVTFIHGYAISESCISLIQVKGQVLKAVRPNARISLKTTIVSIWPTFDVELLPLHTQGWMFLTQLIQRLANDPFDNIQLTFHPSGSCNYQVWKQIIKFLTLCLVGWCDWINVDMWRLVLLYQL